jgi:guanylate kinase
MSERGVVLVIAAPSGAGKTSLARELVSRHDDMVFALSATTRAPREGERDGVDYRFVDSDGFDELLANDELLEWAVVHGRRYGTLRDGVTTALNAGQTVVLDIDVQGARQVRVSTAGAVLVFILPPSAEELMRRLVGRASESAVQRHERLTAARSELAAVREFDFVVVNDHFDTAVETLESIVVAEKHRAARMGDVSERAAAMAAELNRAVEREL